MHAKPYRRVARALQHARDPGKLEGAHDGDVDPKQRMCERDRAPARAHARGPVVQRVLIQGAKYEVQQVVRQLVHARVRVQSTAEASQERFGTGYELVSLCEKPQLRARVVVPM